MDQHDEQLYEKRARAGLIPYLVDDRGELVFLVMVASNSKFGGPRPMISKGKIEDGESTLECAVREAEEELGLLSENLADQPIFVAQERVALRSGAYQLTVYAVPIRDRWNFGKWCDETEYTAWLTLDEFREQGRRDHVKYLELLTEMLNQGENHAHADFGAGPSGPASQMDQPRAGHHVPLQGPGRLSAG